jgi:hypothetical protein
MKMTYTIKCKPMETIKRILYAGDQVYWNHHEHGMVPCKVLQNEDGFNPKIRVEANLPDMWRNVGKTKWGRKTPATTWPK